MKYRSPGGATAEIIGPTLCRSSWPSVVTEEGFPLSYEVFEGNRADVTTLEEILDSVERKRGALNRVWVFDRGIVSEENLALLRRRGAFYLVATPRRMLDSFQNELVKEDWSEVKAHPQIQLKLVERDGKLTS